MSDVEPLLSVLVTVYNRAAYLSDAISSILKSTISDYEIIVCDDASTDNSFSVASELAKRDVRIRLYRNSVNLGQFANRNFAASVARGRWIKFLDSDDLIYPHGLEAMHRFVCSDPQATLAVSSSQTQQSIPYPFTLPPEETYRREFLGRGCLSAGPSASIIRRDAFEKVGGYRNVGVIGDIDLWYRMSAQGNTVFMPPALIWWRQHDGQAFSNHAAEMDYLQGELRIKMDALISTDCPLNSNERRLAISRCRQNHARRLWRLAIKKGRPDIAYRYGKVAGLSFSDWISGLHPYK